MISQRRLRLPALGAAVIATAALLSACSGGGSSASGGHSDQPITVLSTFGPSDVRGPAFAAAMKAYTKKTGIAVKASFAGANDIFNAYETSVLAGKEPDVLIVNLYDKATTWTDTGATVPVTQYLSKWGLDKTINPAAVGDWTDSKGRLQAFPYTGFTWPMWYNQALFTKAGIDTLPTTTDELIADAAKLNAAGITPLAISGGDSLGEKFFLQVVQSTVKPDETKKLFASGGYCKSTDAMKGIDLFLKLSKAGVFSKDAQGLVQDNMVASFYQSKAAMMPQGSWSFAATPSDVVPGVVLGGFPIPSGSTFTKPLAYQGFTAAGIWLTKNGQKRLSDFESFTKFMYTSPIATSFVSSAGDVPVVSVASSALTKQPLLVQALDKTPKTVDYAVFPDFYVPGAKTNALITATSAAFAPGATAQAVCSSLDSVYN